MLGYLKMGMFQTILSACVLVCLLAAPLTAASLRGYPGAQLLQNERADADRLSRLEDRTMLQRFARLQLIDPIPSKTRNYYLHSVPTPYRYLRPWAKLFLDRLSSQYRARFRKPLRVTSLTRTAAYQKSLRRKNSNAAAANGQKALHASYRREPRYFEERDAARRSALDAARAFLPSRRRVICSLLKNSSSRIFTSWFTGTTPNTLKNFWRNGHEINQRKSPPSRQRVRAGASFPLKCLPSRETLLDSYPAGLPGA